MDKNLLKATEDYWTRRADGYSKVNQEELTGVQHTNWKQFLVKEIEKTYPGHQPSDIHILDIGCGPGFFSAILAECGYVVTAIDYTQVMLKEAKDNAATCGVQDKIRFLQMDAQALTFADTSFDVVVSRNLTWNLQEPAVAYKEWCRVLKKGGLLLNFDANWYGYLFDEKKRQAYEEDRKNTQELGVEDHYVGTDIDAMERIAYQMPLSPVQRPTWDEAVLKEEGVQSVSSRQDIGSMLLSEVEQINYAATPIFMVRAEK